jgi:hypothetical protein
MRFWKKAMAMCTEAMWMWLPSPASSSLPDDTKYLRPLHTCGNWCLYSSRCASCVSGARRSGGSRSNARCSLHSSVYSSVKSSGSDEGESTRDKSGTQSGALGGSSVRTLPACDSGNPVRDDTPQSAPPPSPGVAAVKYVAAAGRGQRAREEAAAAALEEEEAMLRSAIWLWYRSSTYSHMMRPTQKASKPRRRWREEGCRAPPGNGSVGGIVRRYGVPSASCISPAGLPGPGSLWIYG